MPLARRAVIDIGTNSVKLLVADVSGRTVVPVLERSEQTRLGEGFYVSHVLQPRAITRTAQSIANFVSQATELRPNSIRVIATSAARDAVNQSELVRAVEEASGLKVEVISGEQEAQWAFAGVTSDCLLADRPLLILDVGGGSTELILGQTDVQHFRESYPLGTVRMLEQLKPSDPPTESEWRDCETRLLSFCRKELHPRLDPALKRFAPGTVQLVGTGGTTTILARIQLQTNAFDRVRIEATRLSRADVNRQREHLWSLPLQQRKQITGLPPNRADVILMGVAIFAVLMNEFGFDEVCVSTRGLRFAAVMDV